MKFRVAHLIHNIDLPAYEALYFDEAFSEALCQSVQLRRKLIARQLDGNVLHRAVMVGPEREIPKPVAKVLGASHIEYTEHIEYVMGSYEGCWQTLPQVMADKVSSAGTFRFEARGHDVLRIVEGDVQIKIFGLGGIVERFIAADVDKSYAAAAAFTNRYLQDLNAAKGALPR